MAENCPFCTIPQRELLFYSDEHVYLVKTKDMKGHKHRVTVATHRHTTQPTFEELTKAYSVLYDYMNQQGLEEWYIVDRTFGRWPDHWHLVSCCGEGTQKELVQLAATPKVQYPLQSFAFYPGKIMIGIPAYNEEENIAQIVKKAKKYGEVYVYNDLSTDKTEDKALDAGARIICDTEGKGYGHALSCLFDVARAGYDALITLDGDGQHNPDEIPRFLSALNNSDIVLGNRFKGRTDIPKHRSMVIKTINQAYKVEDSQCGFRAYNKLALDKIEIYDAGFGASLEILNRVMDNDLVIDEVPVSILYEDVSHTENPIKQGMNLLESLFWGTVWARPYSFLGIPAFISLALSIFFGGWLVYFYARSQDFVLSYALLTVGFLILTMMLGVSIFFITVQRRLLKEIKT